MITKFKIPGGVNDYATVTEPEAHPEERKILMEEGYQPWSTYTVKAKGINYGKKEELWMK